MNKNESGRGDAEVVEGTIESISYSNQENGFHVFRVRKKKKLELMLNDSFEEETGIEVPIQRALEAEGIKGVVVKTFSRYPITRLKGQFLNKQTRAESLHTSQVILIKWE